MGAREVLSRNGTLAFGTEVSRPRPLGELRQELVEKAPEMTCVQVHTATLGLIDHAIGTLRLQGPTLAREMHATLSTGLNALLSSSDASDPESALFSNIYAAFQRRQVEIENKFMSTPEVPPSNSDNSGTGFYL